MGTPKASSRSNEAQSLLAHGVLVAGWETAR